MNCNTKHKEGSLFMRHIGTHKTLFFFIILMVQKNAHSAADSSSTNNSTISAPKIHIRKSDILRQERFQWDQFSGDSCMQFFIGSGYSHLQNPNTIAHNLFGTDIEDECRVIRVQGSAVEDRNAKAWLADYFYLPRNYDGYFTIKPHIATFFIDAGVHINLANCLDDHYLQIYGSFAHSRWSLGFKDFPGFSNNEAPRDHDAGYFSPRPYSGEKLVQSFGDFVSNCGIPQLESGSEDPFVISDAIPAFFSVFQDNAIITFNPLKYARINACGGIPKATLAGIHIEYGKYFHPCKNLLGRLGLCIRAPTGNKHDPSFLFNPIVGNGKYWELGGTIGAHYLLQQFEKSELSIQLDATITHLFSGIQKRTFDLKNKPNSAYMLACQFDSNPEGTITLNMLAGPTPGTVPVQIGFSELNLTIPDTPEASQTSSAPMQFALVYAPLANITTIPIRIDIAVQAQVTTILHYKSDCWDLNCGYSFWGRSREHIKCPHESHAPLYDSSYGKRWALKGDARMFGYQGTTPDPGAFIAYTPPPFTIFAVPLSATESSADIHGGTNNVEPTNIAPSATAPGNDINLGVDSPQFAYIVGPLDSAGHVGPLSYRSHQTSPYANTFVANNLDEYFILAAADLQIKTSSNPQVLRYSDLDLVRIRSLSHTIFGSIQRQWKQYAGDHFRITPFLGIGFSIEFGVNDRGRNNACNDNSESCEQKSCSLVPCRTWRNCAGSEWSLWVRGGANFW